MKWLLAAAAALFLIVTASLAAYAYFTPYLTMRAIHEAAMTGDTKRLEEHVDFPKVKASLKQQIRARIDEGAAQSSNPLAAFGSALAGALAEPAVDALVTSENVARLLRGEELGRAGNGGAKFDNESFEMGYEGMNRFVVTTHAKNGFVFVLEREGALSWRLTEVRLPETWRIPTLTPSL